MKQILIFIFSSGIWNAAQAEDPFIYQQRLSNLAPAQRLQQLELDLNPVQDINFENVNLWQRDNQFKKCLQDETQFLDIERTLIESLASAIKEKNVTLIKSVAKNSFKWFTSAELRHKKTAQGIKISFADRFDSKIPSLGKSFLADFHSIDWVDLKTIRYQVDPTEREKESLNYNQVSLAVEFDIRGLDKIANRIHDTGMLDLKLSRQSGRWLIVDNLFSKVLRRHAYRAPSFSDQTAIVGLDKVKINERTEAIRRGGYTLVADDLNGDGWVDLFSGSAKESQLFLGSAKGFKLSQDSSLSNLKAVKTAIFADFDNDGDKDVFMTLFEYNKDDSDLALLWNKDGRYEKVKGFVKGKLKYNLPMPAAVADFNKDNLLDLYVGFPGKQDFTILDPSNSQMNSQGIFQNLGQAGQSFVDVTKQSWGQRGLAQYTNLFPHSSLAVDYDLDGDSDILVIDDRSNLSPIYQNKNGKSFDMVNDAVNFRNKAYGMGATIGDLDNDGVNEIALTNVNFKARERLHNSCNENWYFDFPEDRGVRLFKGVKSRVSNDNIKFIDYSKPSGLDNFGEGAAGIEFIDYNNDGLLDIYVSMGLWSGESRKPEHDLSSLFARAVADRKTFDDVLAPNRTYRKRDWSFISILRDENRLVTQSMAGYQRNKLYLNLGNMEFVDVGFIEGVDSVADGYIVAVADPNKDGKMDLILRNGDPGTMRHSFPTIEYFQNNSVVQGKSLVLSLEGRKSNRDAIGAIVDVKLDNGQSMHRQVVANNGPAQSERIVHFGIKKGRSIQSVKVRWPSGLVQKIGPLKKSRYHLIEGYPEPLAANN